MQIQSKPKTEIEYPTNWQYRIIALSKETIKTVVKETMDFREYTITEKNKSKTGKYISMEVTLIVTSQDERDYIFETIQKHPEIKMVL